MSGWAEVKACRAGNDVTLRWQLVIEDRVQLHSSAMLPLEGMHARLIGMRGQRWDGQAADDAARLAASLPRTLHDDGRDRLRAWELASRYDNYPIYDMLYVALAERLGEPLVTIDDKPRRRLAHLGLVLRLDGMLKSGPIGPATHEMLRATRADDRPSSQQYGYPSIVGAPMMLSSRIGSR